MSGTSWGRGPGTWNAQWARTRQTVIQRDGGTTCHHCHTPIHRRCNPKGCDRCRQIGHIIAKADGGPDHPDNCVCLCRACNTRGRTPQPPPITPPQW